MSDDETKDIREPYEELYRLVLAARYSLPDELQLVGRYKAQAKLMEFLDQVSINDLIRGLGTTMDIAWESMNEEQRRQVPEDLRLNTHTV